jgi:hypothetical protein
MVVSIQGADSIDDDKPGSHRHAGLLTRVAYAYLHLQHTIQQYNQYICLP